MKISVIIPVYNSQKYLPTCINSIRNQTYKKIEILLVDDGSTDGSDKICDEYAEQDCRIKVIHQKNSGTSIARNTGLYNATGEYIMFMDNDDYWNDENSLELIVKQLKESQADVLLYGTVDYWESTGNYNYPQQNCRREEVYGKKREEALKCLIEKGLFYRAVWSKAVKRSLIMENSIFFIPGIRNEDSEWTAKLMICAQSYDWLGKSFYIYRKGHEGAQTTKANTYQTVCDLKTICLDYMKIAEENKNNWNQEFLQVYFSYFAYLYSVWMAQAEMLTGPEIKQDVREMKKYAYILHYDLDPSVKLVNKVYKICGYYLTAKLLKIYMKRKYNVQE